MKRTPRLYYLLHINMQSGWVIDSWVDAYEATSLAAAKRLARDNHDDKPELILNFVLSAKSPLDAEGLARIESEVIA